MAGYSPGNTHLFVTQNRKPQISFAQLAETGLDAACLYRDAKGASLPKGCSHKIGGITIGLIPLGSGAVCRIRSMTWEGTTVRLKRG